MPGLTLDETAHAGVSGCFTREMLMVNARHQGFFEAPYTAAEGISMRSLSAGG